MSSGNIYQHTCEKCQQSYSTSAEWGSKRFCCRACANSRFRPQELRARVGAKLRGRKSKPESIQKGLATRRARGNLRQPHACIMCGGPVHKSHKRTCSRECWIESKRAYALKQESHGGCHKGKYNGIPCDSTYELAFLIWNLDHSIDIARCNHTYSYTYKGKLYSYKPDFVVEGQVVEIKGWMTSRSKAKLEQNPHVYLVDKNDIQPFIKYVKTKYKVKDLRDLYDQKDHQIACEHCAKMFTPNKKIQRFCGHSCAAINRNATRKMDPDYKVPSGWKNSHSQITKNKMAETRKGARWLINTQTGQKTYATRDKIDTLLDNGWLFGRSIK